MLYIQWYITINGTLYNRIPNFTDGLWSIKWDGIYLSSRVQWSINADGTTDLRSQVVKHSNMVCRKEKEKNINRAQT